MMTTLSPAYIKFKSGQLFFVSESMELKLSIDEIKEEYLKELVIRNFSNIILEQLEKLGINLKSYNFSQ